MVGPVDKTKECKSRATMTVMELIPQAPPRAQLFPVRASSAMQQEHHVRWSRALGLLLIKFVGWEGVSVHTLTV